MLEHSVFVTRLDIISTVLNCTLLYSTGLSEQSKLNLKVKTGSRNVATGQDWSILDETESRLVETGQEFVKTFSCRL